MTDYFAALMRAAGRATDAPSQGGVRAVEPAANESAQEPFEIDQMIELDGPLTPIAETPIAFREGTIDPAASRAAAADSVESPAGVTSAREIAQSGRTIASTPLHDPIELATTARVHPAVRAALDWVRSDPGTSQAPPHIDPLPEIAIERPAPDSIASLPTNPPDAEPVDRAPDRAQESVARVERARIVARHLARAPAPSAEAAGLELEEALAAVAWTDREVSRGAEPGGVELSIGSIRVSIDPPAVSASLPPPAFAPPPRAATPGAADARGFSRRRLPRV